MNSLTTIATEQTYLTLPDDTNLEQWSAMGRELYHRADRMTWALGDWADFGDRVFGQLKTFCEAHGLSYTTVKEAAAVARSVPKASRSAQLLFGHHFEVSTLDTKQQTRWLAKAESEKWSPLDLRKAIRDSQGEMSLVSDGKPLKLPTKHAVELRGFLEHRPEGFWTAETREFWRKELQPIIKFWRDNLE